MRDSTQAVDLHNINCEGYGRIWHKPISTEPDWVEIPLPYHPAAWKLDISIQEASVIQVFQSAGCNYRCWYCYVDYKLLRADPHMSRYFTCESLLGLLQKETFVPKVIRLSGGQPELTPEWTPWMMKALKDFGLDKSTYLWLDDNLSNYYAWTFLTDEDWNTMLNYRNFGRVGCLKGFDPKSFHYNTNAPPEHFYRQLDVLKKLVRTGIDQYIYITLTSQHTEGVREHFEKLLDRLQDIHPNLPLRVSPQKIKPYYPTLLRMTEDEEVAMTRNQYYNLAVWKDALAKRFTQAELSLPCFAVDIGQKRYTC